MSVSPSRPRDHQALQLPARLLTEGTGLQTDIRPFPARLQLILLWSTLPCKHIKNVLAGYGGVHLRSQGQQGLWASLIYIVKFCSSSDRDPASNFFPFVNSFILIKMWTLRALIFRVKQLSPHRSTTKRPFSAKTQ